MIFQEDICINGQTYMVINLKEIINNLIKN